MNESYRLQTTQTHDEWVDENGDVIPRPDAINLQPTTRDEGFPFIQNDSETALQSTTIGSRLFALTNRIVDLDTQLQTEATKEAEIKFDEDEREVRTMSLNVRLALAEREFGFVPHTHEELNRLLGLTDDGLIKKSATYIARIQRRNISKNQEAAAATKDSPEDKQVKIDPTVARRTAESIISQYASYARSAHSQRGLLLNLQTILSGQYKRSELARSVSILQYWMMDASTEVPIRTLMKQGQIESYMSDDADKKSPLQIDYSMMPRNDVRVQGDDYIKGLTVGQLQNKIAELVQEQQKRFEFWTKALKDSLPNNAARDSALEALSRFNLQ